MKILVSLDLRALSIVLIGWALVVLPVRAQVYERVFDFTEAREAAGLTRANDPQAGLVQSIDGNYYGTTYYGGALNCGTVFKVTPGGVLTILVDFTGNAGSHIGKNPASALVEGSDGIFYGTTSSGGANGYGTVFRMTNAGELTNLVEFTGNGSSNKGRNPMAGLVQGIDGNFYGTTYSGGGNGYGTVFRMTPAGALTTLVEFTRDGASNRGEKPLAGLIQGIDGNFYGTTQAGGSTGHGTVFRMTSAGLLTTLVEFSGNGGSNKGSQPRSALVQSSDGNFYGTTAFGGASGLGTVYRATPAGVLTTLVEFTGGGSSAKGSQPYAALVHGSDGVLYGTTQYGAIGAGQGDPFSGHGTAFKMTLAGELTTLVEFGGSSAPFSRNPVAPLILGSAGNFYGTTLNSRGGTIFKMTQAGVVTIVAEFPGGTTAGPPNSPAAEVIQASDGSFYGTTELGGSNDEGAVFKLNASGELTTLVNFTGNGASNKGSVPAAALVQHEDGNFFGTTVGGGANNLGTVFRMTPGGLLTTLVEFTGDGATNKGGFPRAALVVGTDGWLYGTTESGGANGGGTVFKMTPAGILTTLVEFTGNGASNRGYGPCGAITLGVEGEFYGTTRAGGTNNFGTVFKVTADGVLTTLVDFTGDGAENKGSSPRGTLVLSGDNHFYGTTEYGGGNNSGTVFRITPDGTLTTLAEFNPTGTSHKGFYPQAGVALGNDGNIYGTTLRGGENGYGTIFKMTADGTLTTIRDCNSDSDAYPRSSIIAAADGNLYGTTNGPDGTVFRLILPGSPTVVVSRIAKGNDSALVEAHVNARGAITAVSLEYGTDNLEFPNIVGLAAGLSGYQTRLVGTTLSGLNPGTTYFFRFRAVSGEGVTVSAVHSFSTLSEPLVTTTPATDIAPVSARFNGTVNARNYDATVRFEWGTNGNSFPNTLNGTPTTVVGNADVSVSAPVAGLVKGTTYYYRIVATNAGGTTVSGTQSFRTLTEPTASISGNFALTTTSVRVEGAVDAQGSDSGVVFEYGIDGVSFPNSMTATPGLVAGETSTPVSAVLTTLSQGVTYHYRIRATSAGGIGISPSASFSMNVLSGFTQVFPAAPPEAQGFLFVNLAPSGILHGWRFVGERQWRSSGIPVGGLTTGDRNIEFRPVPGYIQPPRETVSVISGEAATILTRDYYETTSTGSGGLTVTLKPEVLADSSVPQATRAQWRLLGEDDTKWRDSAMSITGLSAGAYLVECKPVAGRTTPVPANVIVNDAQTAAPTITYFLPDAPTGTPPAVLAFEAVSTDQTKPYAHVGQLRSNAGSSTGFVVKQRVVATAAHVVWDDGTLSAVQGLQWLHQQHRGTYEPKPITPRGFYIFDGYAAQRVIDNSPGDSSPESQTLDVAAIYFNEDAGRGGYGGFLASDLAQNEFLLSNANKMLFGYPVDGVATNSQGRMFATSPANVTFTAAFGRTFTTTGIRGFGGNSGGPLCVQFEGGNYYPAAIYLGGTNQTVVRAIDSSVIDLFNRAETSGNGGDNNTGGGITHSSFSSFGNTSQPGALEVIIQPAAARNAGAGWRLKPETSYRLSGNQKTGLNAGDYRLQLNEVSGFQTPSAQTITVNGGQLTEITYTYEEINTAPTISNIPNQSVSAGGSTGPIDFTVGDGQSSSSSLSITRSSSNPTLVSVSSIVLGGSGASRHVEVTPVAGLLGTATITLTVSDGELTDSETFQITVTGTARQTWRFANFGTTFDTGNAADSADPDGDGQTNIDEYAAGTDPNNSSDRFSILTVTKGTSSFTVTAPGKAGRSYWLERRQSLDAGPWVSVDSESPLAVNGTVALTDSSPPENKGFYRVRVSFP